MVSIPIVSLDKIYIRPDENNIYFLDCTRVEGSGEIISRKVETLDEQVKRLSETIEGNEIILADDVVFSGSVLRNIINRFNKLGVKVVGVISSICTTNAYRYFNERLKYGIRTNYILGDEVIDQICERDFYFGIVGSGIMVEMDNKLCKAPYFKPYGNPCERASIPKEEELSFSRGCLYRNIYLWEEVEKLKQGKVLMKDLPERIVNTTQDQEVVKVLRMEMKRLWKNYK